MSNNIFTSECVTNGHPDKVADQISDAILDECLRGDKHSHVACEVMVTTNKVIICGEITSNAKLNIEDIVRETIKKIGYIYPNIGFDYNCEIFNYLHPQSANINAGVSEREDGKTGAGDQGLMFGYATNECEDCNEFMPAPMHYARLLSNRLTKIRSRVPAIMPDGKTQVTYDYDDNKIKSIVLSSMHTSDISLDDLRNLLKEEVIKPVIGNLNGIDLFINPCGEFIIGGPDGDTGLTGRKIIVDTYGGMARHGGGAFSGKDPSKVDRSAAYMMRYIAKNIVAAGLCDKCEIQVAYAIGHPEPVSIVVNTFGAEKIPVVKIIDIIKSTFDLTPDGIIDTLDLLRPIYSETACYGHFGYPNYPWEQINKVADIQAKV